MDIGFYEDTPETFRSQFEEKEKYNNIAEYVLGKLVGKRGVITNLIYRGEELRYQANLSTNYVKFIKEKRKEKVSLKAIDLVELMIKNGYKADDITKIISELKK